MISVARVMPSVRSLVGELYDDYSEWFREENLMYLRDVQDHSQQALEFVKADQEILSGMIDLYLSLMSQKTNDKMKVLGFVTRIVTDQVNGGKLAVVYVPTTPNPTSGYLEIVPLERIVYTDLTFEQGMSFIVTGGAIGPDSIRYSSTPSTSDGADQRDNPQD